MSAQKAYGATLNIGNADLSGTPAYASMAGLKKIGDWEIEAEMADVTNHQSTGGYREKFPVGIFSVGDLELTISYDPAEATHDDSAIGGLMHALLNNTKLAYQIVLNVASNPTWTFEAYVSKLGTVIDTGEEELQQNVTLMITGQPTLA